VEAKINIEDYLSENEIKEIVEDEFKNTVRQMFCNDTETTRLIGNMSYRFIWKCVDDKVDGGLEEKIVNKTLDVLNNMSDFSLFRRKDCYEPEDSVAQKILNKTIIENENIIINKVINYLTHLEEDSYIFDSAVKEAIIKKITG
jgi:hypothetical protein